MDYFHSKWGNSQRLVWPSLGHVAHCRQSRVWIWVPCNTSPAGLPHSGTGVHPRQFPRRNHTLSHFLLCFCHPQEPWQAVFTRLKHTLPQLPWSPLQMNSFLLGVFGEGRKMEENNFAEFLRGNWNHFSRQGFLALKITKLSSLDTWF